MARTSPQANAMAIYWIHREWEPSGVSAGKAAAALSHMFEATRLFLHTATEDRQSALKNVYAAGSALSLLNFEMSSTPATEKRPVAPPSHASRANQYLRFCINDFERMRVIRDYRTPEGLRLFATFLLHVLAIFLGPKFADYCDSDEDHYGCPSSYFTAVM